MYSSYLNKVDFFQKFFLKENFNSNKKSKMSLLLPIPSLNIKKKFDKLSGLLLLYFFFRSFGVISFCFSNFCLYYMLNIKNIFNFLIHIYFTSISSNLTKISNSFNVKELSLCLNKTKFFYFYKTFFSINSISLDLSSLLGSYFFKFSNNNILNFTKLKVTLNLKNSLYIPSDYKMYKLLKLNFNNNFNKYLNLFKNQVFNFNYNWLCTMFFKAKKKTKN